ncbi:MAG TPA: response regulator transcription factor [Streptosporangiaceae bacterium]|nr:response regulator transcription factor [Streptosporangiaceae bacterium]
MAPDRRASSADEAARSPTAYQEHQALRGPYRLYTREYPGVEPTLVLLLFEWPLAAAETGGMAAVTGGIRAFQAAQTAGPMPLEPTAAEAAAVAVTARNLFRREGEYWTVAFQGAVVRLRDAKGLRQLARVTEAFEGKPGVPGSGPDAATGVPGLVDPLTGRELQVLAMLAAGSPNRAIAKELFVTIFTVKKHVSHIFGKLGVANRTEAVARARDLGLIC